MARPYRRFSATVVPWTPPTISPPTAASALGWLIEQGIVQELTGYRRNRVYSYKEYLRVLNEGTELPA